MCPCFGYHAFKESGSNVRVVRGGGKLQLIEECLSELF